MRKGAQWKVINRNYEKDIVDRILENRGLTDPEEKNSFLNPDFEEHLHSPYLLKDMAPAVERILIALKKNEKILIFGDYDADGVTATALLYDFFHRIGANFSYILPHRLNDGYGVTPSGIRKARELGASVVVTVDNGISANAAAEEAIKLGIDLIITDHHQEGGELPRAVAVVNPNRHDCAYPFKQISGVGVAYKLVTALAEKVLSPKDAESFLKWSLDLVAMGTVADIMPLVNENRVLVYFGLKVIEKANRPGIRALLNGNGQGHHPINTSTIGYQLGPRINAAGRLEKADIALKLLISNDFSEANQLSKSLNDVNQKRQQLTLRALEEAESCIDLKEKLLIVNSPDWHPGIIGLVAGKLCEKYNRPALAFARLDDESLYKGSARSPEFFDITEAMMNFDKYLESVGGHRQAGGCSVNFENFSSFCQEIKDYTRGMLEKNTMIRCFDAETVLLPWEINLSVLKKLKQLAPFGQDNPNPLFFIENVEIISMKAVGFQKKHLQMRLRNSNDTVNAIGFGLGDYLRHLSVGQKIDLMAELSENNWNNQESLQIIIKDIRPAELQITNQIPPKRNISEN